MVDFTIVNPSSRSFDIGRNINNKLEVGVLKFGLDTPAGSGILSTFVSDEFHASGDYSVPLVGSGSFEISVTPQNGLFQVSIAITGVFANESRNFLAAAKQVDKQTIRFDEQNGDLSLTLAQDGGNITHGAQIDITISWRSIGLYVQRPKN